MHLSIEIISGLKSSAHISLRVGITKNLFVTRSQDESLYVRRFTFKHLVMKIVYYAHDKENILTVALKYFL